MLCEKSYVDIGGRMCELMNGKCIYEKPDKSVCPIYERWLRKNVMKK